MIVATNRRTTKTWSLLGDVKRKPSPYEAVTAKFHYHFKREPAPFEMDPETAINKWYLKNREGSPLMLEDWEQFRDPAKLTYKDYVAIQRDRETYVDGLIDQAEAAHAARNLAAGWVKTLTDLLVPLRFPLHVLQITSLYVGQMAPTSFITNCAYFQASDELRRIQRMAYWTKVLANAHGDEIASTHAARGPWESAAHWQPLRQVVEELLIAYDWGEAFTALNLVVKPMVDALVNEQLATLAAANGDQFLNQLLTEFNIDSKRSQDWSQALAAYCTDRDPQLHGVISGWLAKWQPKAKAAIDAIAPVFAQAPNPMSAQTVSDMVARRYADFIEEAGLPVYNQTPA